MGKEVFHFLQLLFLSLFVACCPQLDSSVILDVVFCLLFFCPLSCFIHYSPPPLICERQKRSLPCTPHVSRVQHELGSIHVMSQTVRRDGSVTLTPSPPHDLYCLTSCSPSSGFKKTAEGVCEHVYDPCHF